MYRRHGCAAWMRKRSGGNTAKQALDTIRSLYDHLRTVEDYRDAAESIGEGLAGYDVPLARKPVQDTLGLRINQTGALYRRRRAPSTRCWHDCLPRSDRALRDSAPVGRRGRWRSDLDGKWCAVPIAKSAPVLISAVVHNTGVVIGQDGDRPRWPAPAVRRA